MEHLIGCFYDRVACEDLLSALFPGGVTHMDREHVTTWWVEVFGGPAGYSAMGGYPRMLRHQRNLAISAAQRFRFASLMSQATDDAGLPPDPELRARVRRLRGVGHPARAGELPARCRGRPRCTGAHWGWGGRSAVSG